MEEMVDSDVGQRVRATLARVFQLSAADAQEDLRMGSLPRWDSMGHMQLIMEIEKEFGVTFPTYEIAELLSADAITNAVAKYKQSAAQG